VPVGKSAFFVCRTWIKNGNGKSTVFINKLRHSPQKGRRGKKRFLFHHEKNVLITFFDRFRGKGTRWKGCQIFLDTIYQNEVNCTKLPQLYQMAIKYSKLL
jgi:hypothetical protein